MGVTVIEIQEPFLSGYAVDREGREARLKTAHLVIKYPSDPTKARSVLGTRYVTHGNSFAYFARALNWMRVKVRSFGHGFGPLGCPRP